MSADEPPNDEEVSYVGIWLDDHLRSESYYSERWAPFVRCVAATAGEKSTFQEHPRPIFGGTSFYTPQWRAFGRSHAEGIFVETPAVLVDDLLAALHFHLNIRGVLKIEALTPGQFRNHSLACSGWIAGDVCVSHDRMAPESGIRFARPSDPDLDLFSGARSELERMLRAIARESDSVTSLSDRGWTQQVETERVVLRVRADLEGRLQGEEAMLFLFSPDAVSGDASSFENELVASVAEKLQERAYRSEITLWVWRDSSAWGHDSFFAAVTSRRRIAAVPLFLGVEPRFVDAGNGALHPTARPVLRWKPPDGLVRLWPATSRLPLELAIRAHGRVIAAEHRVVTVIRRQADASAGLVVTSLELKNFRAFENFSCEIVSRFTVVIGDNGHGKTSLLRALAATLYPIVDPEDAGSLLREDDVRESLILEQSVLRSRRFAPMQTSVKFRVGNATAKESLTHDGVRASRSGDLSEFILGLRSKMLIQRDTDLPLYISYGVGRTVIHSSAPQSAMDAGSSRVSAYSRAFDAPVDLRLFQEWFARLEVAALRDDKINPVLEGVRVAVSRCIEGCTGIQYSVSSGALLIHSSHAATRPFKHLSDGFKVMLAMVADIAWRCCVLNPHLGAAAIDMTSGVVLIDELDLHLHPRWQRHVVDDLLGAFPLLQFVATTHSPFIVQSMHARGLINLDDPHAQMEYQNASIEDIAEKAMLLSGVQRSERFHAMVRAAEAYYLRLEEVGEGVDLQALRSDLDLLMSPFLDNPAFVALLRFQRALRGV